jgi:hypothetical protein
MIKNTRITIRFPAREAGHLAAEAEASGMNFSDYVRQALARRLDLEQLAAALARDLAAELRSDFQTQATDVDAKLKLISDQIAALSMIIKENRK